MRKSRVSCVSRIVHGITRKSCVNHEYHAYILRKSRVSCVNHGYHAYHALYQVSCVSQIVPGIMRKSRVSCVNHGYHAYHALFILQDIPPAQTETIRALPVDGSSQVLQRPSRCRRLMQTCAVYCFEDADHGLRRLCGRRKLSPPDQTTRAGSAKVFQTCQLR